MKVWSVSQEELYGKVAGPMMWGVSWADVLGRAELGQLGSLSSKDWRNPATNLIAFVRLKWEGAISSCERRDRQLNIWPFSLFRCILCGTWTGPCTLQWKLYAEVVVQAATWQHIWRSVNGSWLMISLLREETPHRFSLSRRCYAWSGRHVFHKIWKILSNHNGVTYVKPLFKNVALGIAA